MAKTTCPITREQFATHARTLKATLADVPLALPVKEFSTGSLGWYANGKTTVEIDGQIVSVQYGVTMTIVGSKELPR